MAGDSLGELNRWKVSDCDMPWRPDWDAVAELLVGEAALAPSSRNAEPWRFRMDGNCLDVYLDESKRSVWLDPDGRDAYVSLGCALENLLVGAAHLGYEARVEWFPRPGRADHVARVELREGGEAGPLEVTRRALFDALARRRTRRGRYGGRAVSPEVLDRVVSSVTEPGLRVHVIVEQPVLQRVAELAGRAKERELANPSFRRELGTWLGNSRFGRPGPWPRVAELAVRHLHPERRAGRRLASAVASSAAVVVLTAKHDTREVQVKAGMALERMWLAATVAGLSVQPLSSPLRFPEVRAEVARLAGAADRQVVHMFRLGYGGRRPRPRPRRPVAEVLETSALRNDASRGTLRT